MSTPVVVNWRARWANRSLLAPLGADYPGDLDRERPVIVAAGKLVDDLRRLSGRAFDDARLKQQFVQLVDLAAMQ